MQQFNLKNKVIVVTGASSGIGRQCAIQCAEAGAKIILLGRDSQRLLETARALSGGMESHKWLSVDLADQTSLKNGAKEILQMEKVSEIHGIVHSAGVTLTYPFRMTKPDKLASVFQINVYAAFELTRLLLKRASSEGMGVVFITSVMASVGEKAKSVYSMSKGALLSGSRSLALELANKNIRVNCVSPGVVDTPMTEDAAYRKNEEAFERIQRKHPLGLGKPEYVANAVQFLLSDASAHITGIDLKVDGGYTAR